MFRPPIQIGQRVVGHATTRGVLYRLEWLFVTGALFIFSGAVLPILLGLGDSRFDPTVGNPTLQLIFGVIYVLSGAFVLASWQSLIKHKVTLVLILLILAYVASSSLWSYDQDLTLRRSVALLGTSLFGLQLGVRFSRRAVLDVAFVAMAATIVACIVFLLFTSLGTAYGDQDGAVNGAFIHKNSAGRAAAFTLITGVPSYLYASRAATRVAIVATMSATTVLLLATRSVTALLVCVTTFLFIAFVWLARRWPAITFATVAILLVAVGGLFVTLETADVDAALQLFGRDLTLTGRVELWALLLEVSEGNRAFGSGYNAFWGGGSDGISAYVWQLLPWEPPHAHNGYLDILLELGWVGLVAAAVVFLRTAVAVVQRIRRDGDPYAYWALSCLWMLGSLNLTESTGLSGNNLFTVIFLAIAFGRTGSVKADPALNRRPILVQRPDRRYQTHHQVQTSSATYRAVTHRDMRARR